jgi:hypothetical protein
MEKTLTKKDYDLLIKKSLPYSGAYSSKNEVYFGQDYLERLFQSLKKENLLATFDKEVCKDHGNPEKIGSVASSARLCYFYFHQSQFAKDGIHFEHQARCLDIERAVANLDAYSEKDGQKTYYECKCHEFVEGEQEVFIDSYLPVIEKHFGIANIPLLPCIDRKGRPVETKTGKPRYYLQLSQGQMGIHIPSRENDSLYSLHFNAKQLICHLLGIANEMKKDKENGLNLHYVLHYVFFVPSFSLHDDSLNDYYSTLAAEIEAISKSKIQDFAEEFGIFVDLKKDFANRIDVATIEDFVSSEK